MNEAKAATERILGFVVSRFPVARTRRIKDSDPLLESGIVDSMGVLELVEFLEQEFGVQVTDEELIPENFQTIQKLAAFVSTKRSANPNGVRGELPDLMNGRELPERME